MSDALTPTPEPTAEQYARLQVLLAVTQNQLTAAYGTIAERETDVAILQQQVQNLTQAIQSFQTAMTAQQEQDQEPAAPNRAARRAAPRKKAVSKT